MKHMKRIVLDTNVFVSGIFWKGPPHKILEAWSRRQVQLILSNEILEEYTRVGEILTKKYSSIDLFPFIELLTIECQFYKPISLREQVSIDRDDDKFIACALAAEVDYLISGDKHLLDVNNYKGLKIIKPRQFVDRYL